MPAAEYFQTDLDATPWDQARSRSAVSTRRGMALETAGGALRLLAPPNPPTVVASAPVEQVTVRVTGLAAKGAGALVDFGAQKWMVDFGRVATRTMTGSGAAGMLKRFLGAGSVSGLKQGRALRDGFVEAMGARGARIDRGR